MLCTTKNLQLTFRLLTQIFNKTFIHNNCKNNLILVTKTRRWIIVTVVQKYCFVNYFKKRIKNENHCILFSIFQFLLAFLKLLFFLKLQSIVICVYLSNSGKESMLKTGFLVIDFSKLFIFLNITLVQNIQQNVMTKAKISNIQYFKVPKS